jgi:AMMECR1 domain-containing protein
MNKYVELAKKAIEEYVKNKKIILLERLLKMAVSSYDNSTG